MIASKWWPYPLISAVLLALSACAAPRVPLPRPTTTDELLTNLKTALGDDRFFDDAFYTEQNLQQFFGGTEATSLFVEDGKPTPFTVTYIKGFSAMVPPMRDVKGEPFLLGLSAQITKITSNGKEHGKIVRVLGHLEFHSEDDHLEAKYVMKKFDYPWTEDREAENNAFMAIAREPFNPPAKPQHIMHYVWTERGYTKLVQLNFGGGHYLWTLGFSVVESP